MSVNILVIGDNHIKCSNILEFDTFVERIQIIARERNPDLIVLLGDILDTHEKLNTIELNKACDFIDKMRKIAKTIVLVGNHDMVNCSQFLTTNHWMNALKEWKNVLIVDTVITHTVNTQTFIFVPFVPNGRFIEALNTVNYDWLNTVSCIFAHQEFYGCKMGAINSIDGDKWPLDYPHIISGHIHSRQFPQDNIYYTGSSMQQAFGESDKNIIAYVKFNDKKYEREEIDLLLPRKKIVYVDMEGIDKYILPESEDKIKVSVSGDYEDFKALKKTSKYKDLVKKGVKVVFKPKKKDIEKNTKQISENIKISSIDNTDFKTILTNIIYEQKNINLLKAFEFVVNNKNISSEDMILI